MSNFVKRTVFVYDLPLAEGAEILRPEQVILKFANAGSIDFGSLCYLHRDVNIRQSALDCKLVNLDSFNHERAEQVGALIKYASYQYSHCSNRTITVHDKIRVFVSEYMRWADNNRHFDVLKDKVSARIAFQKYVIFLREKSRQNIISVNWASKLQGKVLYTLENFFEIDDFSRGVNLVKRDDNSTESIKPPCEKAQSKVLALTETIFRGFLKLVTEKNSYPFRLSVPKYLGWENDWLWIFPIIKWCMPPHELSNRNSLDRSFWAYDYANGRLTEFGELKSRYPCVKTAKLVLRLANNRLLAANENHRDSARILAAMRANYAFVILFISNTGMNTAQVFDLTWNDKYEVGVERQGFRAIKWRAAGRECHFEISSSFLPNFKRYLKLREYLLNGTACDYLFFTTRRHFDPTPTKMPPCALGYFYRTLQIIDPQLPKITPSQWRAAKSDWLISYTDPATTALILQNTEATVLKHYAEGSETKHLSEMSTFLNSVAETVVSKEQVYEHGIEGAVGICSSFGTPLPLKNDVPVTPDCRRPEGCLFCDKFKVHVDERDTRKLLSCRYCLQQTLHLASSEEQIIRLFTPLFDRIQSLLDEISRREEVMVARIIREVEEDGELDPFWASKLEMLASLEVIA